MKSVERHISVDIKRAAELSKKAELYSKKVAGIVSKRDYTKHESALAVPGDTKYQNEIEKKIAHLKGSKYVVLVGIGGSSLSTEAVYEALAFVTHPSLLVLDAIEEEGLREMEALLAKIDVPESLAVIVISKSGTTTETIANGVKVLEECEKRFGKEAYKRVVFVGTKGTDFLRVGKKRKVICITIPESIGGRYSVFTAVGIVPLSIIGIDTVSFREGAMDALLLEERKRVLGHAVSLALLAERGVHTVNFFTFNERLEKLGFWYRQLLAESIGKTMTTKGTTFCHQLQPTVATSVDLHSMAQLYLGGYRGVYTHFVHADEESEHHKLSDHWLLHHMRVLEGHTGEEIKTAIREGVLKAYDDQKLPYRLTSLGKITAYELGLMMATLMFEVMTLCDLFNVNAFDQPSVESYKSYTKEALKHRTL